MRLQKIVIKGFRNISELIFEPSPGINLIMGDNGHGKTSLLEAIGFLSDLRSFKTHRAEEVIQRNQNQASLVGELCGYFGDNLWKTDLAVHFLDGQKSASINGKTFKSSTQYIKQRFGQAFMGFHSVVFSPADHDLVRLEPLLRRNFLDKTICAENLNYLQSLQKLKRVIEQRNSVLKSESMSFSQKDTFLMSFDPLFIALSASVTYERLLWIRKINPLLQVMIKNITTQSENLQLNYLSKWVPAGLPDEPSLKLLEELFEKKLFSLRELELRQGSTLSGPHRDDWGLFFGEQPVRGFGSQGEVRSALLALKLSEIEIYKEATQNRPVLLLDDFSSELDRGRREFLLSYLENANLQVFITSTEPTRTQSGKSFWINQGQWQNAGSVV